MECAKHRAFDVEALLSEGAELRTAGYLKDFSNFYTARQILLRFLETRKFIPIVTNSFDGSGSVDDVYTCPSFL